MRRILAAGLLAALTLTACGGGSATTEPTRLGMISYAVFCLKKKKVFSDTQKTTIFLVKMKSIGTRHRYEDPT